MGLEHKWVQQMSIVIMSPHAGSSTARRAGIHCSDSGHCLVGCWWWRLASEAGSAGSKAQVQPNGLIRRILISSWLFCV